MEEQFGKLHSRNKDNALYKHWKNSHPEMGDPPPFTVDKVAAHRSATERQIGEALEIEKGDYDELLNSKSEWGMNRIPRQVIQQEDVNPQPHQEAAPQSKRGPPLGDENKDQHLQGSPTSHRNDAFDNQYTQRRKRIRLAKRLAKHQENDEPVGETQGPSNPPSHDDRDRPKLVNSHSTPLRERHELETHSKSYNGKTQHR